MTIRNHPNRHSWGTFLQLDNKRDLSGRGMSDEERMATRPWHPGWEDQSIFDARRIKVVIGEDLHSQFVDALPEVVWDDENGWSYQQRAQLFRRVFRFITERPNATISEILTAALVTDEESRSLWSDHIEASIADIKTK